MLVLHVQVLQLKQAAFGMDWQNLAPMQDAVQTLFKDTRPLGGSRLHPGSGGGQPKKELGLCGSLMVI